MNRTDRLLSIVLELQAKGWQRAEDLAATFEISRRTIYRDMMALMESGVPVISSPGQGFSLMEGYFLPPLSFSTDEAILLLLGCETMMQSFDAQYQGAARSASSKIVTVLTEERRQQVEQLRQSMRFIAMNPFGEGIQQDKLRQLRRAILDNRRILMDYQTRSGEKVEGTPTRREADPYALIHVDMVWYLAAYCHLRTDVRYFRLDRIDHLQVLNTRFQRPADLRRRQRPHDELNVRVRVLFDAAVSRWVLESPSFYMAHSEPHPDGLLVTFQVRQIDDVLPEVLRWGAAARVLEPEALQQRVLAAAAGILANYEKVDSLLP